MNEIQYFGESLWPGQVGHFAVLLAFVSALFAACAYYFAFRNRNNETSLGWLRLGRTGFIIHGVSVFTIIAVLFYAMYHQMYEYNYVFSHVSPDLAMRYILSAFWEGQEGSFLLWMFWHVILGIVLIFTAKRWEAPVMINFALIEAFISTMILGIYIPGFGDEFRIGSNPTLLLRNVLDAPIFANADYLNLIEGQGLNALLQNYWMTIHPPTLFLGFASVAVPFSFAMAGLWTGQHKAWLRPVMKWAAFSAFTLGTGILMGGAWAYEALSFGGYWAWDPVENTSLVPWIILIAGLHTNLIARKTGYSIKSTYIFYSLSFILILYSTFLTRSGILGDSSAHAFTEMGLEWQLVAFILFFLLLGIISFVINQKSVDQPKKEESISSKEFWMFIGALILFFSAMLIISSTSLPVYNSIVSYFKPDFQGRVIQDPMNHYNRYQLWIAIFIGILSGGTQFLRYKSFNWAKYRKTIFQNIVISLVLSLLASYLFNQYLGSEQWVVLLLLFTAFFTIISNLSYLLRFVRGNIKLSSSILSHVGFGILILGILCTGLKNSYITSNEFAQRGIVAQENLANNIALIKGNPFFSQGYWINYEKDTVINRERRYQISFKKINESDEVIDEFKVYPNFLYNKEFTKAEAFNPDTKHYLNKDIFTILAALPSSVTDMEAAQAQQDSLKYVSYELQAGDTIFLKDATGILEDISFKPEREGYVPEDHNLALGLQMSFIDRESKTSYEALPITALKGSFVYQYPDKINALGLQIRNEDRTFDQFFSQEEQLEYKDFELREFESFSFHNLEVTLNRINRDPNVGQYSPQEGDIAVAAELLLKDDAGRSFTGQPVFIIRDNSLFNIKDYIPEIGLHLRFIHIDPKSEMMSIRLALDNRQDKAVGLQIAENVPRSDIIYFEAQVFPWINLVWLGSILILLGLMMSFLYRMKVKKIS